MPVDLLSPKGPRPSSQEHFFQPYPESQITSHKFYNHNPSPKGGRVEEPQPRTLNSKPSNSRHDHRDHTLRQPKQQPRSRKTEPDNTLQALHTLYILFCSILYYIMLYCTIQTPKKLQTLRAQSRPREINRGPSTRSDEIGLPTLVIVGLHTFRNRILPRVSMVVPFFG